MNPMNQPSKPIYLSIYLFEHVFLYLNDPEEDSSKTKRNNHAPGNDISDIEHLLDDQPISELHSCVHVIIRSALHCKFTPKNSLHPFSTEGKAAEAGRRSGEATV